MQIVMATVEQNPLPLSLSHSHQGSTNSHRALKSVSSTEHLDMVLNGLPDEYESMNSLVSSRFQKLSIDKVETLLLVHEAQI